MQDEIAASVTAVIAPKLAAAEQERVPRKPQERLEAWQASLVGWNYRPRNDFALIWDDGRWGLARQDLKPIESVIEWKGIIGPTSGERGP